MPARSFSFQRSRLQGGSRSSRSRSPNPSRAGSRNDTTTSPSLNRNPSHASSFHPPSNLCIPELGPNVVATSYYHPPAPGNVVHHQTPTGGLLDDRVLDDSSRQPSLTSRPVNLSGTVPSNAVQLNPHGFTPPSNHTDSFQVPHSLVPLPAPYPLTASSQHSQYPLEPPSQYLPQPQHRNQVMFSNAHDFTANESIFVAGNVGSVNSNTSSQFMEKLLKETIPGAASDSSDRDPPPRCHPGTRLSILDRCLYFIRNCDGQKKVRWVVGAAGVGKSAVMQSVAESPELSVNHHASVFFSINGRNDGTKTIITISYQLAAKSEQYRQFIEKEITRDPSLLRSSMAKQFVKLIIEPFVNNYQLNSAGRVLVIIDGLDECKNPHTQLELLRLITDFSITYPSSPLVWLIACRPEAHITSFFNSIEVMPAYEKEEILVDSNEARADVERFLRYELMQIKKQASDSLNSQWPEERHVWKLANASGGLFAHAQTVVGYIGDSTIGSPALQLSDVLNVIDDLQMTGISPEEHPMALLDALYARILSNVPSRIMINTRKLLLTLASNMDRSPDIKENFLFLCNWLGMTPDEAYAALNHLRSVLYVPRRDRAHQERFKAFHKSFIDYICDFTRSGFSRDIEHEARQLMNKCTFRILKEVPDGIDFGDADYDVGHGYLARGPGAGNNISLTWSVGKGVDWDDDETRLRTYKVAIREVTLGLERGDPTFQSEFCIRLLTTRFQSYHLHFPHYELRDLVFDKSRRREFTGHGILKLVPLKEINISHIIHEIKLHFRHSATTKTYGSDRWSSYCRHKREGVWEEGRGHNWTTRFHGLDAHPFSCPQCLNQLEFMWKHRSTRHTDYPLSVLFTSAGECCVEFEFEHVNWGDVITGWTYWFWIRLTGEERDKYRGLV